MIFALEFNKDIQKKNGHVKREELDNINLIIKTKYRY